MMTEREFLGEWVKRADRLINVLRSVLLLATIRGGMVEATEIERLEQEIAELDRYDEETEWE